MSWGDLDVCVGAGLGEGLRRTLGLGVLGSEGGAGVQGRQEEVGCNDEAEDE